MTHAGAAAAQNIPIPQEFLGLMFPPFFFLPKSGLGRRKYLSFDRCVNTPGCPQDTSDVVEMRLVEPQENGIKSAT